MHIYKLHVRFFFIAERLSFIRPIVNRRFTTVTDH